MKRTITTILLLFTCMSINVQKTFAQEYSALDEESKEVMQKLRDLFRDNIASLDPIEGEYDCECYGTYVTPFVRQNIPVQRIKVMIVRESGTDNKFLVGLLPNGEDCNLSIERIGETNAYSMSYYTSPCRIYLQNNNHFYATIRLNHESAIEYTGNRRLGRGIDISFTFDFIKTYPTAAMYADAIKEDIEEAQPTEWTGTGFALTNNYIVTNNHVVEGAKSIYIQGVNGNFDNKHSATVVATDKYNDLALLKMNDCTISSASIPYSIKTSTTDVGEEIFVLGYPLTSTMGDEIKLTTGVVSSKTGFQGNVSMYQISAPIQPGNSGGPLFDSKGNVIGIVSAKHQGAENVGYAVKASYLRGLIESATSADILPHNNKMSTLNLTSKVKAAKNFVYYITCSSKDSSY